jgi:hypothetical protein
MGMDTQTAQERQLAALRNEIEAARERRRRCHNNDEHTRLVGYIAGLNVALKVVTNPDIKLPY